MFSISHLKEKGGGIPYLIGQVTEVLKYKCVNVKEFLDDIFKRNYSYALL